MNIKPLFRRILTWIVTAARRLWIMLSRRTWMKLFSLLLAVLLWNYVISSNNSITRTKTITGVSGYITGQSAMNDSGLALLSDPTEEISNVTVRMEVAQSLYSQVSPDNVQVMLDLSSVRTAGTQAVPLKASSTYGRVTSIIPETVTLTFETLDSRLVPVNAVLTGVQSEDKWYNISRSNPSAITVSGAASVVRSIAQAQVRTDVTGAEDTYTRAEPYVLLDGDGREIDQSMLNRSVTSISVSTEIYPTKELPISTAIEDVVTGRVADGYVISDISIQPESITVAAEQSLLDGISQLLIEPVSVEGLSQSFSVRAAISLLSDFKNESAEQVYVNITISEEDISTWISNSVLTFVGKAENLQLEWPRGEIQVYVTGPRSVVESLSEEGIPITVDLTGLEAGSHICPLIFPEENYPDVTFEPEFENIEVTLTEVPEE